MIHYSWNLILLENLATVVSPAHILLWAV